MRSTSLNLLPILEKASSTSQRVFLLIFLPSMFYFGFYLALNNTHTKLLHTAGYEHPQTRTLYATTFRSISYLFPEDEQ